MEMNQSRDTNQSAAKQAAENNTIFAIKGTMAYTPTPERFVFAEDSYLVCGGERVMGIWKELPEEWKGIEVFDYTGKIIFPGMCDMHLHAPQYAFRGLGMNLENPDWDMWFEKYAFPDEKRYADCVYAKKAYERLTEDLLKTTTTRCVMFATLHRESTEILMDLMEEKGIASFVGKVNMDRNSIPGLLETTEESLEETKRWLADCEETKKYRKCHPVITPRYIPTCTDALMRELGKLAVEKNIPIQSHLSEGLDEMEWVKELKPDSSFYAAGYDEYHMMGDLVPAVMAHCVYSPEEEISLMKNRKKLIVAHCPQSNISSSGGIAPIKRYLAEGIRVGLGTDMAGSNTLSLLRAITDAIHVSKARWAYTERGGDPHAKKNVLSLAEAFYLATHGGEGLWEKVGSFEEGFCFDAVVMDDERIRDFCPRSSYERCERLVLMADDRDVAAKFIDGRLVYQRDQCGGKR